MSHQAITNECCQVKSATACIIVLLNDGASLDTLICAYHLDQNAPFQHVTNDDIITVVCTTITHNPDSAKGYTTNVVGMHSLWVDRAMDLFRNGL